MLIPDSFRGLGHDQTGMAFLFESERFLCFAARFPVFCVYTCSQRIANDLQLTEQLLEQNGWKFFL